MISLTNYTLFLLLPLGIFLVSKASLYRQGFGLIEHEVDKARALANLALIFTLILMLPTLLILNLESLSSTFVVAIVYALHTLYLSLDCFKSSKNISLNINFAILLFLMLLKSHSVQAKYLTLIMCFVIALNKQDKPIRFVEFYFISFEALFLSFVFTRVFALEDIIQNALIFVGFFSVFLSFSQLKIKSTIYLNMAKLSCMVFIVYLLYLCSISQWHYWF